MNPFEMHRMVEFIRAQTEFPFDALDVEESLEQVLGFFGFHPELDGEARRVLRRELFPIALGAELGEVARAMDEAF